MEGRVALTYLHRQRAATGYASTRVRDPSPRFLDATLNCDRKLCTDEYITLEFRVSNHNQRVSQDQISFTNHVRNKHERAQHH